MGRLRSFDFRSHTAGHPRSYIEFLGVAVMVMTMMMVVPACGERRTGANQHQKSGDD
jgi:hypothetical protein